MKDQTVARRIKELRMRQGFSQEELADRTQLSLRTIQRIENGETRARGDSLQRLSRVLGTTPEELFGATPEEGLATDPEGLYVSRTSETEIARSAEPVKNNAYLIAMNLSALAFLLFPGMGIITPLALWMVKKEKISGIDETGKRILNFQITWFLVMGLILASVVFHWGGPDVNLFLWNFRFVLYAFNIICIGINVFRVGNNLKTRYVLSIPFFGYTRG